MIFFKKFHKSKIGSNLHLYRKFMIPLYFKLFFRKSTILRTVDYIRLNSGKNSLIGNISRDLNKVLSVLFFLSVGIHALIYLYFIHTSFNIYILGVVLIFGIFIFGFFLINIFLLRTLDKNIIQKFEQIKFDMNKIKKGDISKRKGGSIS